MKHNRGITQRDIARQSRLSMISQQMLAKSKGISLAISAVVLAALLVGTVLPSAVAHATTTIELCANKGTGLCVDDNSSGNILTFADNDYTGEQVKIVSIGTVSQSWPFSNSNYDSLYSGDEVADLQFVNRSDQCMLGINSGGVLMVAGGSCGASGYLFVRDGSYGWVNVSQSDQKNSEEYLCSQGSSDAYVVLQAWTAGYCQWATSD